MIAEREGDGPEDADEDDVGGHGEDAEEKAGEEVFRLADAGDF